MPPEGTRLLLVLSDGTTGDEEDLRFLPKLPFTDVWTGTRDLRRILLSMPDDDGVELLDVDDPRDAAPDLHVGPPLLRKARRPILSRRARAEAWRRVEARHLRLLSRATKFSEAPRVLAARVDAGALTRPFARTPADLNRAARLVDDVCARLHLLHRPAATVFVGATEPEGRVRASRPVMGARDAEGFLRVARVAARDAA